jgi:hypothetical protein
VCCFWLNKWHIIWACSFCSESMWIGWDWISFNSKQVKIFHNFSNLIQSTCYRNNQTSPKWPNFLFFSPFFEKIIFRPLNVLITVFYPKLGATYLGTELGFKPNRRLLSFFLLLSPCSPLLSPPRRPPLLSPSLRPTTQRRPPRPATQPAATSARATLAAACSLRPSLDLTAPPASRSTPAAACCPPPAALPPAFQLTR